MAYIGAEPVPGQNREIDDISSGFNGSATAFTLQVSSTNVSPESANNILVNLGGVMQNPGTDYTIAASTITFTTAPASGLSFWALILGAGINTATVADDTIGSSKLIDTAVTAGSYTTADITVDAQGRITAAASGTISGAEIADQAVTNAKVNNSAAIAASKIADFVTGNTNNRVLTATGTANSLNGEANLTFDGSNLLISGELDVFKASGSGDIFHVQGNSTNTVVAKIENAYTTDNDRFAVLEIKSGKCQVRFNSNGDSTEGAITYEMATNNMIFGVNNAAERMRIDSSGNVGIGTTSPESKFAIKASSGSADLFSISDIAVPTSGDEYGVAMIKSNAAAYMLSITGYNSNAKGVRIYNNGGSTGRTSFEIAQASGTKFIVDGTGNVGIGTSSPSSTLTVSGNIETSGDVILTTDDEKIQLGASQDFLLFHTTDKNFIYGVGNHPITFSTNNSEKMRLLSNGKLLINRTNEDGSGQINLALNSSGHGISTRTASNGVQTHLDFGNQNGIVGSIQTNGSGTSFNTSSDYRLKENVAAISDGITRLKTLKPYRFNFIADASTTVDGFLAHEVSTVPEAISGTKDAVDKDSNPVYQQIDQSKLVPLLTAALQEAITKIETLETKVAALEAA